MQKGSLMAVFGTFNRFHFMVVLCYQIALTFSVQLIFAIYLNYKPRWRCLDDNTTDIFTDDCSVYRQCSNGNLEIASEFQSALMDYGELCTVKTIRDMLWAPLIYSGVLLGSVSAMSTDILGRRKMVMAVLPIGLLMLAISGRAPTKTIMIATRFMVLVICGFMQVAATTYCMELVRPEHRMPMRAFANWGNARLALTTICYFTGGWKLAALVSAICATPALVFVCIFPESPTWLYHKGRFKSLHASETKIARIGRTEQLSSCRVSPKIRVAKFSDLWGDVEVRRRLFFLAAIWFAVGGQTYTNDLHSDSISDKFFLNQFLTAIVLIVSKWCLGLMDLFCPHLNRRNLQYISQIATTVCYGSLSIMCYLHYEGAFYMFVYLMGTIFIEFSWDVCYLTTIESMPTAVRASALAACSSVARVANIAAAFVKEVADIYEVLPFIVIAILGLFNAAISIAFLRDTKGNDLNKVTVGEGDNSSTSGLVPTAPESESPRGMRHSVWYIPPPAPRKLSLG